MGLGDWFGLFLAAYIFCVTPGPGIVAILATTMGHNGLRAIFLSFGLISADMVYCAIALFGLSFIVSISEHFFLIIRLIGGAYLIALGVVGYVRAKPIKGGNPLTPSVKEAGSGFLKIALQTYLGGFAISLSNPKTIIFYLGFLPAFIDLTLIRGHLIAITIATLVVALFLGCLTYIVFARGLKIWIQSPQTQVKFARFSSVALIVVGVLLLGGFLH